MSYKTKAFGIKIYRFITKFKKDDDSKSFGIIQISEFYVACKFQILRGAATQTKASFCDDIGFVILQ